MMKKEQKKNLKILSLSTLIIFIIFFLIPIVFFILLNSKTGSGFGLAEILFSSIISIMVTLFLIWTKSLTMRNPYLGSIIGLSVLGATQYALFFEYNGGFTIIFSIIISIIVIFYLGINFFKALEQKNPEKDDYYEEEFTK